MRSVRHLGTVGVQPILAHVHLAKWGARVTIGADLRRRKLSSQTDPLQRIFN